MDNDCGSRLFLLPIDNGKKHSDIHQTYIHNTYIRMYMLVLITIPYLSPTESNANGMKTSMLIMNYTVDTNKEEEIYNKINRKKTFAQKQTFCHAYIENVKYIKHLMKKK